MKAMMSKGNIFLSCLIPILLLVNSCGGDLEEPPDSLSIWEVEYDYMWLGTEGYELFPSGSNYASGPLAQGNISLKLKTDPSENPSHQVPVDVLQNYADLIEFFNLYCVPYLDSDGDPVYQGDPSSCQELCKLFFQAARFSV